jgi:hypothetical protein
LTSVKEANNIADNAKQKRTATQSEVRDVGCRRSVLAGGDSRPDYGLYVTLRRGTVEPRQEPSRILS